MSKTGYQPLSSVWLNRIFISIIILLAIMVGYLSDLLTNQTKLYQSVETRYSRIQQQLGAKEVQRLLDQTYEK